MARAPRKSKTPFQRVVPAGYDWQPIHYEPARVGRIEIKVRDEPTGFTHEDNAGRMRCAIFGGIGTPNLTFQFPTRWHELIEHATEDDDSSGVWMTDKPIEQAQMLDLMHPVRVGQRVLVGGLGLGVLPALLQRYRYVSELLVIEASADVTELILAQRPDLRGRVSVATIEDVAATRHGGRPFHWALLDTWASDGARTLFQTVLPLRRQLVASGYVKGPERVRCWNEAVMRGQIRNQLESIVHLNLMPAIPEAETLRSTVPRLDPDAALRGDPWSDWMVPFLRLAGRMHAQGCDKDMLLAAAAVFAENYE